MPDPASLPHQIPAQLQGLAPAIHVIIALLGLIDCFLGFRIFKATVRILMAFAGAGIGAAAAVQVRPESMGALAIGACVGLVAGLLLGWFMYRLGVFVLGFFLGVVIATPFAQTFAPNMEWIVVAGAGIACGVLTVVLINLMVMAATALTGAFRLVYGVAFFFGGPSFLLLIHDPNAFLTAASARPLFGLITLFVGAIGFYYQWTSSRPKKAA